MATSQRWVGVVLTLWMVVLRPSAAIHTGSPNSVGWGSSESVTLRASARRQITAGNFTAAESLFQQGAERALLHGDRIAAVRYLSGAASAQMARLEYREALNGYLKARSLASQAGDRLDLGSVAFNLSTLYGQVWDFDSALRSAEEGLEAIRGLPDVYYQPQLLLQLGRLHAGLGDEPAEPFFVEGIEASRKEAGRTSNEVAIEAQGWEQLGLERQTHGNLAGAETAEMEAFRLRRLFVPRDLGFSYSRLAALRLAEAEATQENASRARLLREAESLIGRAFAQARQGSSSPPAYWLYYYRGLIRLARGRVPEALQDLGTAAELAGRWRVGIMPDWSSLDGASSQLGDRIFGAFAAAAADYGVRTHSRQWLEQSLLAEEMYRTAHLKDSQALVKIWREKLPLEYQEVLGKLQAESALHYGDGYRKNPAADRLKLKLTEMEAQAGFGVLLNNIENFHSRSSLIHFQQGLRESEVVLSFDLGDRQSFLWAVTRRTFRAYALEPGGQIRAAVREFREAVEAGRRDSGTLGKRLYTMLFGQLHPDEVQKPEWLLSLEDELFELPFAALVPGWTPRKDGTLERTSSDVAYLGEAHSLQVVPALLLSGRPEPAQADAERRFLAVGDPIYNVADPRWQGGGPRSWFSTAGTDGLTGEFNRLPGSGQEVESSAQAWSGRQILLEGRMATREEFLASLNPAPSIIHLATHVLTPLNGRDPASLVFGLGSSGRPEMLATADVAMLHVPGSLVVMTGCYTAAGDSRAGAGVAGLTRAWIVAGARAVVATHWPVKDSAGELLARFYGYLPGNSPAEALRRSQVELIHSGTALAAPAVWASYQVFGAIR